LTEILNCNDAAEFVSALCDGEIIPPEAARHIGECAACQGRLNDYLAMGVELRRVASLEGSAPTPALALEPRPRSKPSLWQKGWETMRIPKFAFALLILGILALASSLAVVKVGARSSGSVLKLSFSIPGEKQHDCFLDTRLKIDACGLFLRVNQSLVGFDFQSLARDGDRVQLGIRAKAIPPTYPNRLASAELAKEPQAQYSFEVGQTLNLNVENLGVVPITGEWTDHIPTLIGESQLDPSPDELRFVSPLLLRDKRVVGDMEGATSTMDKPEQADWVYFPGEGSFIISVSHIQGGREASVNMNRVSFDENGHSYTFITGAPVSREKHLWVLHQPDFKPQPPQSAEYGFQGSLTLRETSPGVWESPLPHD
jgi:hypothetical protein